MGQMHGLRVLLSQVFSVLSNDWAPATATLKSDGRQILVCILEVI